jgi:hypothetical protein
VGREKAMRRIANEENKKRNFVDVLGSMKYGLSFIRFLKFPCSF